VFVLCLGENLNNAITDVYRSTTCPCTPQQCEANNAGYKIGIALVQEMQDDREVHSIDELSELVLTVIIIITVIFSVVLIKKLKVLPEPYGP